MRENAWIAFASPQTFAGLQFAAGLLVWLWFGPQGSDLEGVADVVADAEVLDTHVEIPSALVGARDLGPWGDSHFQRRLNDVLLGLADFGMVPLSRQSQAHRIIGGTELHHIHTLDRQQRFEILD